MRLESVKLKEERQLFFAIENETRDYGCIGHLRGDFGSGKEFWTTWFPHTCHELNDEHFKTIFDAVINELRSEGQVLSGRCNMFNYAHTKHDCKLTESIYKPRKRILSRTPIISGFTVSSTAPVRRSISAITLNPTDLWYIKAIIRQEPTKQNSIGSLRQG